MAEIENLKIGNGGTLHIVGNEDIVANAWQAGKTYVKNKSYVIREHRLYVCNVTHTSVEPFDATKWTEITIGEAIDNALDMTDTASGAIATFESEYALPLRDLEIEINAVQAGSGTPSPDNVRPITGFSSAKVSRTGKNLMPYPYANTTKTTAGITFTDNGDGTITANGTATSNATFILHYSTTWIPLPKGTYTLSGCPAGGSQNTYRIHAQLQPNSAQDFGNSATFVEFDTAKLTTGAIYIAIAQGVTVNNLVFKPQIELGSTATAYEAYGQTYPVSLGQTVYGGSLNVTTGVLTVTHGIISDLGSLGWSGSNGQFNYNYNVIPKNWTRDGENWGKCSALKVESWEKIEFGTQSNNSIHGLAYNNIFVFRVYASDYSTADELKSALSGQMLVYELVTPVTYQLTPTQISAIVGTNNVFTDTNGDTSLEYYTKRGEQTVRIAEGVAVDVINNKNIDNLTTTNKTLVGAVNEVVSDLTPKQFTTSSLISIQGNETVTQTFTVTNAKYGIITGFAITSNLNVVALQFFFNTPTTVQVRVKNVSATADVFGITFFYI